MGLVRAAKAVNKFDPAKSIDRAIQKKERQARSPVSWGRWMLVGATVVFVGCNLVRGGISGFSDDDAGRDSSGQPSAEAPKDPPAEEPRDEPEQPEESAEQPPEGAGDPGVIDSLYAFLIDEGGYPSGFDTVEVSIPPNGPDEVTATIEQVQATNRGLVSGVDPSMVNAVTVCAAAEMWRREGDWRTAAEQLEGRRFDEADITCTGIVRNVASNAPPSGTSYINIPELVPVG